MLKNAVLCVLLLSSFIFGQDTSFWKPYITDFQGKDVIKMEFNNDKTKLYFSESNCLHSYNLEKDTLDTLFYSPRYIRDFFVNDYKIYVAQGQYSVEKIYSSFDEGNTWNDLLVPDLHRSFYVKSDTIYISRWFQLHPSMPPNIYGIWRVDSMGNNLTYLKAGIIVSRIEGIYNGWLYYKELNSPEEKMFALHIYPDFFGHKVASPTSTYYINETNGDVFYRKTFNNNDSLFKAGSNETYNIPKIEKLLFFDSTNIFAASELGFYVKLNNMSNFVKFISKKLMLVNDIIKDKDNHILLATNKGLFRSTFKLSDLQNLTIINENLLEVNNFNLSNNYPNPFNPSTKINFTVDQHKHIKLKVFDLLGKEVKVLVDEFKSAGSYDVDFNAADLPSGVYIYSLTDGKNIISKKMTLIK